MVDYFSLSCRSDKCIELLLFFVGVLIGIEPVALFGPNCCAATMDSSLRVWRSLLCRWWWNGQSLDRRRKVATKHINYKWWMVVRCWTTHGGHRVARQRETYLFRVLRVSIVCNGWKLYQWWLSINMVDCWLVLTCNQYIYNVTYESVVNGN